MEAERDRLTMEVEEIKTKCEAEKEELRLQNQKMRQDVMKAQAEVKWKDQEIAVLRRDVEISGKESWDHTVELRQLRAENIMLSKQLEDGKFEKATVMRLCP